MARLRWKHRNRSESEFPQCLWHEGRGMLALSHWRETRSRSIYAWVG